ncbi:MAG: histidine triad nucleotide-binding protein [Patescibacteria group bacterium]|nr:histidine triad nucleotide-binding protein [Patescibacteria group bacterium]
MSCLFCKIINKEMPADIILEDDKFICFRDISPKARVHLLILPKKHIESALDIQEQDKELIGELFLFAKKVAIEQKVVDKGYKLLFNVGKGAGQVVDHIHLHLLSK